MSLASSPKPSVIYQDEVDAGHITADAGQQSFLDRFDALHQALTDPPHRPWYARFRPAAAQKGLYLWGGVGTGKTLLMDMFYQSLPDSMARRIHFHRFMQWVHDQRKQIGDQENPLQAIVRDLADKHRVLCLDEFAVTDITDAMILHGLLDAMFAHRMTLVTTSNIPQKDLYKDGLQRDRFQSAIRLLQEHTEQLHIDSGNDYRTAYLQDGSIYHTPVGAETEQALESCFQRLSGLDKESKKRIEINDRQIDVVGTGSGVAWFEFAELCETHRSKMDYIELAKRFHTLILANIPVLDDDRWNATRRLIELVDELYDRGVNLIVSAETGPLDLYTGKKLAAAYNRTASRFQEMSSRDYLGRPHLP